MDVNHQLLTCHSKQERRFAFDNRTQRLPAKLCLVPACKIGQAGIDPTVGIWSLFSVLCLELSSFCKTILVVISLESPPLLPKIVELLIYVCLSSVHLLVCSLDRSTCMLRAGKMNAAVTHFNIATFI